MDLHQRPTFPCMSTDSRRAHQYQCHALGGGARLPKEKTMALVQSMMAIFMLFSVERMSLPGERIWILSELVQFWGSVSRDVMETT
jgi:hypothetical protein